MLIPLVSFGQVKNGKVYTYHTPQTKILLVGDDSLEIVRDTTLVLTSRNYIDGKKQGYEITYYRSGQIAHVVPMVDDLMQGQLLFFMDSKPSYVMRTENYVDGVIQGKKIVYYKSGEIKSTLNYEDGLRQGETKYYNILGKLIKTENYVDGVKQ
tara:strand:- start:2 stop:463 length:462 start_codon:yes stop_codon:yes gene_type:complete